VTLAVIGLVDGAGAGAGAVCANALPANAEMANATVVFLNMIINIPFWLNKKIHYMQRYAISVPVIFISN
jgi:hypothetical protein